MGLQENSQKTVHRKAFDLHDARYLSKPWLSFQGDSGTWEDAGGPGASPVTCPSPLGTAGHRWAPPELSSAVVVYIPGTCLSPTGPVTSLKMAMTSSVGLEIMLVISAGSMPGGLCSGSRDTVPGRSAFTQRRRLLLFSTHWVSMHWFPIFFMCESHEKLVIVKVLVE